MLLRTRENCYLDIGVKTLPGGNCSVAVMGADGPHKELGECPFFLEDILELTTSHIHNESKLAKIIFRMESTFKNTWGNQDLTVFSQAELREFKEEREQLEYLKELEKEIS